MKWHSSTSHIQLKRNKQVRSMHWAHHTHPCISTTGARHRTPHLSPFKHLTRGTVLDVWYCTVRSFYPGPTNAGHHTYYHAEDSLSSLTNNGLHILRVVCDVEEVTSSQSVVEGFLESSQVIEYLWGNQCGKFSAPKRLILVQDFTVIQSHRLHDTFQKEYHKK